MAVPGWLEKVVGVENSGPLADPSKAFKPTGLLGAFGGREGLLNFGLAMMANSGYGYGERKRGLGEIFGSSYLQAQQMAQQRASQKLMDEWRQTQIEQAKKVEAPKPLVLGQGDQAVDPITGKVIASSPAAPKSSNAIGSVSPQEFTTDSIAAYQQSIDPATGYGDFKLLQRVAPQATPRFQFVTDDSGNIMAGNLTTGGLTDTGRKGKPTKPIGMDLRKEFEGQQAVKDYSTVLPLYQRAATAPNTRAGDISVVYALGKMFDPTSVVREGELQLSQNAAPWVRKIVADARSQISGTGAIDPQTRKDILAAMEGQVNALRASYERERERFSGYAAQYGATPSQIVGTDPATAFKLPRKVVRTGTLNGKKVVQYDDGTTEYAQ
jgi:hypothetical protein